MNVVVVATANVDLYIQIILYIIVAVRKYDVSFISRHRWRYPLRFSFFPSQSHILRFIALDHSLSFCHSVTATQQIYRKCPSFTCEALSQIRSLKTNIEWKTRVQFPPFICFSFKHCLFLVFFLSSLLSSSNKMVWPSAWF